MRYRDSGVDIDRANEATKSIRDSVRRTWGSDVLSDVGHFGGLLRMPEGYRDPVLVSSMDGVGTKLLVARMAGRYDTIGRDLVNHCVNDILVQGAKPLFFLDYVATGKLDPDMVAALVRGLADACEDNQCALIGGETAEMPDVYRHGDFDLAGAIVGVVERDAIIDGSSIVPGDTILGLPSSGLHTNGYSLARKIVFDRLGLSVESEVEELGTTIGDELLRVHRSYRDCVEVLSNKVTIRGLAHITGGGVVENLPRILPAGTAARIDAGSWPVPPVFPFLAREGDVPDGEMYRVFNMGLGMLAVVPGDQVDQAPREIAGMVVHRVGEITEGDGFVDVV